MKLPDLRSLDWSLVILPILLVSIGIATIYSTTLGTNKSHLTYNQLIFTLVGLAIMMVMSFYDYRNWRVLSRPIYYSVLALLLLVFILGKTFLGATRWLDLGVVQLQPSELAKVAIILFASGYLAERPRSIFRLFIVFALSIGAPLIMVFIQPDLGTGIIICFIAVGLFLLWPITWKVKMIVMMLLIATIPLGYLSLKDYQKQRLVTFINPGSDPRGAGYNVIQSMIAVGSGGLEGRGLGNGPQSQLNFLPVSHTDFIFAGWSEATGFIGSAALVVLELILTVRVFRIASIVKDNFGQYIAIGFGTMLLAQSVINIGMNIGLAPVAGITLPFVSSGGTSLLVCFFMLGMVQNILLYYHRVGTRQLEG